MASTKAMAAILAVLALSIALNAYVLMRPGKTSLDALPAGGVEAVPVARAFDLRGRDRDWGSSTPFDAGQAHPALTPPEQDPVSRSDSASHSGACACPPPGGATAGIVNAELQQSVLDHLAREKLRQHWKERRKGIEKWFRSLLKPEQQEAWFQRRVARFSELLEATQDQRVLFDARYHEIVAPQWDVVERALEDPIDYATLTEQTRRLFGNEDQLVASVFGPEGMKRFRAAQLETRTRLLAIMATYSDAAWEAIEW